MASNLVNVSLCYIEIELCIAQRRTQVRRLGTQVRGNISAVSILGADCHTLQSGKYQTSQGLLKIFH